MILADLKCELFDMRYYPTTNSFGRCVKHMEKLIINGGTPLCGEIEVSGMKNAALAVITPPSLGFSRQEHGSGLPFPSPMHESEK